MARGEGIKKLSNLFEVYKNRLRAPQKTVVENFKEVVKDLLDVDLKPESVSYTTYTRTLSLRVSGPAKSEILLRKEEILAHLKGRLGVASAPTDII